MCFVAILNLLLSRNLALPLSMQSSQVLTVLRLTLLWPGPGVAVQHESWDTASTLSFKAHAVILIHPFWLQTSTDLMAFSFMECFWPLTHWCSLQSFSYYTYWPFPYPIAYLLIPWPLSSLSIHFSKTLLVIVTFSQTLTFLIIFQTLLLQITAASSYSSFQISRSDHHLLSLQFSPSNTPLHRS